MPFLGSTPATGYTTLVKQDLTPDGSSAAFTLTIPSTTEGTEVFVNNVRQEPGSAYNVNGTTLTFTSTPANTDSIYVVFQGGVRESTTIPLANSITTSMLVDGSITAAKIANGTVVESEIANGAVTVEKMTIDGHLIPTANVTYDLGSSTSRFRDLYLSGTTIELGDQTISSNATHVSMGTAKFSSVGIDDNATNTAITIANDGHVGIGKTPNYSTSVLQLSRNSNDSYLSIDGLLSTVYLGTGTDSNALYSQNANSAPKDFIFVQGTSTAMRIDSDSRVTIGTGSTPATGAIRLKVETVDGDNCIQQLVCNTGAVELQMNRGDGDATNIGHNGTIGYVQTENSTNLGFYIDSTQAMTIDTNGNLLIGTTSLLDASSTNSKNLQVADPVSARVLVSDTGAGGITVGLYTSSGQCGLFDYTNSAYRMLVDTVGRVAFGGTTDVSSLTGSTVGSTSQLKVSGSAGNFQIADTGNQIAFSRNAANYISATAGASALIYYDSPQHWFYNGSDEYARFGTNSHTGNKFARVPEIEYMQSSLRRAARKIGIASYFTSGEYVEICEVAPGGASQNYHIRSEFTVNNGQNGVNLIMELRVRSNTMPSVVWQAKYEREVTHSTLGVEPKIWFNSTTGAVKLVVRNTGSNIHCGDFEVVVQGRDENQSRQNVTVGTGAEITTGVPSGYTEYDLLHTGESFWYDATVQSGDNIHAQKRPNQPMIAGQMGTAMTNPSGPTKLSFNQFWVQQGDLTYDSSTSRFTVPTAGKYRITMNPFKITGVGATRVQIGVNTDAPGNSTHYGHTYTNNTSYITLMLDTVVGLQTNDYIVFYLAAGQLYNQSSDRFNQFSIELIG